MGRRDYYLGTKRKFCGLWRRGRDSQCSLVRIWTKRGWKKKKSKTKSTTRKQPARRTTRNKEESSDADNSSQPSENPTKRRKTQKDLKDFIVDDDTEPTQNKKPAQNKNNQNPTPSIPSNISQHPPPQININSINPQFIQEIPKEIPEAPMYPYYHVTRWF